MFERWLSWRDRPRDPAEQDLELVVLATLERLEAQRPDEWVQGAGLIDEVVRHGPVREQEALRVVAQLVEQEMLEQRSCLGAVRDALDESFVRLYPTGWAWLTARRDHYRIEQPAAGPAGAVLDALVAAGWDGESWVPPVHLAEIAGLTARQLDRVLWTLQLRGDVEKRLERGGDGPRRIVWCAAARAAGHARRAGPAAGGTWDDARLRRPAPALRPRLRRRRDRVLRSLAEHGDGIGRRDLMTALGLSPLSCSIALDWDLVKLGLVERRTQDSGEDVYAISPHGRRWLDWSAADDIGEERDG